MSHKYALFANLHWFWSIWLTCMEHYVMGSVFCLICESMYTCAYVYAHQCVSCMRFIYIHMRACVYTPRGTLWTHVHVFVSNACRKRTAYTHVHTYIHTCMHAAREQQKVIYAYTTHADFMYSDRHAFTYPYIYTFLHSRIHMHIYIYIYAFMYSYMYMLRNINKY